MKHKTKDIIRRLPRICNGSGQYYYRPDPSRRVSSVGIEAIVGGGGEKGKKSEGLGKN